MVVIAVRRVLLVSLILAAACGDDGNSDDDADGPTDGIPIDAPVDGSDIDAVSPDANPLATLQGTGLCDDAGCMTINPLARPYTPRFPLWSDTATKRRWIMLPPDTTIDTSDPDFWKFPVGTKIWKEFTRDGVRVETRYMEKVGDDAATNPWFFATYAWNADQNEALPVTDGVQDANGTLHDIPSRANCRECHEALQPTRVLGFGAIQLDFDGAAGEIDLDTLVTENKLSANPPGTASPHYPLPGTLVDQKALGYMHANCGHCHNPTSGTFGHTPVNLRLDTDMLGSVAATPTYTSTVGVAGLNYMEGTTAYPTIIVAGDADNSALVVRMTSTNAARRMPFRGSEMPDLQGGIADIRAWIESLP